MRVRVFVIVFLFLCWREERKNGAWLSGGGTLPRIRASVGEDAGGARTDPSSPSDH